MNDRLQNVAQQGSQDKGHKLIIEKDVWIPLRDGSRLCADSPPAETNGCPVANN